MPEPRDPAPAPRHRPRAIELRGRLVMLDAWVAKSFEVETREVNQAVARNQEKFTPEHAFRLTPEEHAALRSQGVIPVIEGRGGFRGPPMAYTQKGVARLATVLSAPKALEATDLIIDIFTEVYVQLARGVEAPVVANPSRLVGSQADADEVRSLRRKLIRHLDTLLDIEIDSERRTTVRDELTEVGASVLGDLKARLATRTLENEKLAAETIFILEEVRRVRQETVSNARRSAAETESILLGNLDKKIQIVERSLAMITRLEPPAIAQLYDAFVDRPLLAPPDPPEDDAS